MPGEVWVWLGGRGQETTPAVREALGMGAAMAGAVGRGLRAVGATAGGTLWGARAAGALLDRAEILEGAEVILFPDLPESADVAATMAATLGCGLVSHCAVVERTGEGWLFLVPAFGGMAAIACQGRPPALVGLATGARFADGSEGGREVLEGATDRAIRLELPAPGPDEPVLVEGPQGADAVAGRGEAGPADALVTAGLVVGGGAGAGDPDGWRLIAGLSEALGAGLGATRPAVDEGWAPAEVMIGQSGQHVKPAVYLAVGISGDLQHLVGVGEETTVVAVNSDPAAPILGRADYAVVADLKEFLPVLIRKAAERRGKGPTS